MVLKKSASQKGNKITNSTSNEENMKKIKLNKIPLQIRKKNIIKKKKKKRKGTEVFTSEVIIGEEFEIEEEEDNEVSSDRDADDLNNEIPNISSPRVNSAPLLTSNSFEKDIENTSKEEEEEDVVEEEGEDDNTYPNENISRDEDVITPPLTHNKGEKMNKKKCNIMNDDFSPAEFGEHISSLLNKSRNLLVEAAPMRKGYKGR